MRKKILTMMVVLAAGMSVAAGCSGETQGAAKDGTKQSEAGTEAGTNPDAGADTENVSEVRGTLDEVKDFMFVVEGEDKSWYAFTFEEKPEGLDDLKAGDKVIVKYTGTISEVDSFTGEIISVEKQSD